MKNANGYLPNRFNRQSKTKRSNKIYIGKTKSTKFGLHIVQKEIQMTNKEKLTAILEIRGFSGSERREKT